MVMVRRRGQERAAHPVLTAPQKHATRPPTHVRAKPGGRHSSMALQIRPLNPSDATALVPLVRRAVADEASSVSLLDHADAGPAFERHAVHGEVALDGGAPVAYLLSVPSVGADGIRDGEYVVSLSVTPRLRRSGIGRRLLEAAGRRVRAHGGGRLSWHVNAVNVASRALFRRLGGEVPRRILFTSGDLRYRDRARGEVYPGGAGGGLTFERTAAPGLDRALGKVTARLSGRAVATATYYPTLLINRLTWGLQVQHATVVDGCRRQGLGRALLEFIAAFAEPGGFDLLLWEADETDAGSIGFSRALGIPIPGLIPGVALLSDAATSSDERGPHPDRPARS